MKKYFIFITLMLATIACSGADSRKVAKAEVRSDINQLNSIISEYSGKSGFDVLQLGRFGTSALKSIVNIGIRLDDEFDDETMTILKMAKDIKNLTIVEFEDCGEAEKAEFSRKIERILNEDHLIMEAKDEGDNMKIYGVLSEKGDSLSDFILYSPTEYALICLLGEIDLNSVNILMER